ncbi:DUF4174 domain-containing protein [Psychroflexus tropicus]|uniref:DUF4174 domain-containing protein n=1 Tax=Psychroflexus tropicus TaxID=197345 RepID=UPI00036EB2C8|nr:DUF4174 domain-containing protein [Psychroflexus tropicus]
MKLAFLGLAISLSTLLQVYIDRRIIIISGSEENSEFQNYLNWIDRNSMQIEKRRTAVYSLIDGEVTAILNTSEQTDKFLERNKNNYTQTADPKAYLIDLNGSLLRQYNNVFQLRNLFGTIDGSQMRY